jgi:hypothetical protein|tara:strand:- start:466 stop:744 length:279 start_codon:yes stop_codon:yes gene_type:complete
MATNLIIDVISGVTTSREDTEEEISNRETAYNLQKPINAREKRNSLLLESDWTQVADAAIDKTAWAEYRQLLRDVPGQSGFPNSITWPTEPS